MKHFVIGTAGHIDHGKTALVKALTGIETDRLKEEKKRGITIDLGFANLELSSNLTLSIVDVPGHEKFIKNMMAGATGIDLVLLVIASDEGIMPQTEEHINICQFLGIKHGLIVLTKTDIVDKEWLDFITEEIKTQLKESFLYKAPIIPVSNVKNKGIPDVLKTLKILAKEIDEHSNDGPFRLPIDRIFNLKGFGTVATGTIINGKIQVNQDLMLYPNKTIYKIRGLQTHSQEIKEAYKGQRIAINLQGLHKEKIERGNVLALPFSLEPSKILNLEIKTLKSSPRSLYHRMPVRFHTGSSEFIGRLLILKPEEIRPGEQSFCQIILDSPASVMYGDHYVIRSYSPVQTIAGGIIIHPHSKIYKRKKLQALNKIKIFKNKNKLEKIISAVSSKKEQGINSNELIRLTGIMPIKLQKIIKKLLSQKELILFDKNKDLIISKKIKKELFQEIIQTTKKFHKDFPLKKGIPQEELKQRLNKNLSNKLFNHLSKELIVEKKITLNEGIIALFQHKLNLSSKDLELKQHIENTYMKYGMTPPNTKHFINKEKIEKIKEILEILTNEKILIKVKNDLYYHKEIFKIIMKNLMEYLVANKTITPPEFKKITGLSRKYIISLLEYFDNINFTMRINNKRVLRKRYKDVSKDLFL